MSTTADKLVAEIRALADANKLRLVDAIFTDLDNPDPEMDRIWAEEARERWAAYKAGLVPTVSYDDVMALASLVGSKAELLKRCESELRYLFIVS